MDSMRTDNYDLWILLALAFRSLVDDLQAHLAAVGYDDVRPAHGFAFQCIAPDGATGNEIANFLGITKQAASEMVDYLEKHGYVTRGPHPHDKRGKTVTLTARGWGCIRETEATLASLEGQWKKAIGEERMAALRADLLRLVAGANGDQMPPKLRPVW